jgi:hypothetical protein
MIWLFKKSENVIPEYKDIAFGGWKYAPTEDITAHEVALLSPIFGGVMARIDVKPYIQKNNLTKHFIIPEEK